MWNLLKKHEEECRGLQDLLEESAASRPEAMSVEQLTEAWPAAERDHIASCERCQEAARDLLAAREIFRGAGSAAEMAGPGFSTRVMAAIAAREKELTEAASTWLAVPKFASRLAVASATLLLLTSTWLYEKRLPAPNQQAASLAAQESLFEAPPPASADDVLVPAQENKP